MESWNNVAKSLPQAREPVQFIVTTRREWLSGTFDGDCFRSRWATYPAEDVSLWRKWDDGVGLPAPQLAAQDKMYWSERRVRES